MKLMSRASVLLLTILFSSLVYAAGNKNAVSTEYTGEYNLIILGIGAAIAIVGLIAGASKKVVIYANITDVIFTLLSVLIPIAILLVGNFILEYNQDLVMKVAIITFAFFTLIVLKATFSYNGGLFSFLMAIYTKYFIVIAYVAIIAFIIALSFSSERKKYERRKSHSKRKVTAAAGGMVIFSFLFYLGLAKAEFVSISTYFSGKSNDQIGDEALA